MRNDVETPHKHVYSLYISSLCNLTFPMARFTCIVTSQVFVEIWMRWSIALSSAFYRGRKHLWIVFSFKTWNYLRRTILNTQIPRIIDYVRIVSVSLITSPEMICVHWFFGNCPIDLSETTNNHIEKQKTFNKKKPHTH